MRDAETRFEGSTRGGTTGRCGRLARTVLAVSVLAVTALMCMGGSASADTTHPFLGDITLSGGVGEASVVGVDQSGNLIVWLDEQHELAKFNTSGNPVNFSGLGTNVIDGKGTGDCPATPSDCDEVPTNGFPGYDGNGLTTSSSGVLAAVDNSGGPANGYIYITNNNNLEVGSQVDAFNSAGVFVGTLDLSHSRPFPDFPGKTGIAVSPNGTIVLSSPDPGGFFSSSNAVMYVPVDGNPADDQFAGEFHAPCSDTSCQSPKWTSINSVLSTNYLYTPGDYYEKNSEWVKIPISESHHPRADEPSIPVNLEPGNLVFGNGGSACCGLVYNSAMVDPSNNDVYIGIASGGVANIQQWTEANHKVGPNFGEGDVGGSGGDSPLMMAIDRSRGVNDGHIYARGVSATGNKIAVFGNPVPIPDLSGESAEAQHTTAHLEVHVGLAGGPKVDSCKIEYGLDTSYGSSQACEEPTPYVGDTTATADLSGLAVEQEYHYRFVVETANGTSAGNDHVVNTRAVLGVNTGTATNVTNTGATLTGSLNPDGLAPTHYHFEYGIDTNYTESTPLLTAPPNTVEEQVSPVDIGGLQGGRTYHYRLVASNSLGVTKGPDRTVIIPAAPKLSSITATNVTATSADVGARINDYGAAATFHFEYGTSALYGNSTAATELEPSEADQPVMAHLQDLQPGATYHFQVVVSSSWGTTVSSDATFDFLPPECPNSHVRQLTNANYLPDCRGYELVSPSAAGNVSLFPGGVTQHFGTGFFEGEPEFALAPPNASGLATSPSRFAFYGGEGSISGLHPPNSLVDRYVSTRTNSGWVTTYPGRTGNEATMVARPECDALMDKCIDYRPPDELNFSGEGTPKSSAPYVWDVSGKSLGRWPTNLKTVPSGEDFVGDTKPSPDFSHFFFSSNNQIFAPGGVTGAPGSAYDNDSAKETVTVVSKLQNGDPIPQESANSGEPNEFIEFPAVSADGSHVLMSTATEPACPRTPQFCPPPPPVHLYMRVNDVVTYDVSQGHDVTFIGMTRDGSKVLFSTNERLSSADTDHSVDIYMWNEATPGVVTVVSQGNGKGDTDECNASWTNECDVQPIAPERPLIDNTFASGNGDVYFYSPEQLDAANPGVNNQRNLYVYRDGQVQYVTTFDPGTQVDRMQISPDDTHMAFLTRSRVTRYENQGWEEMYTWEPSTGTTKCASCIPSGQPPTISHVEPCFQCTATTKDVAASESGPFMTNDGRVAFSTADALVPADTNQTIDVYEFTGDRAQLISAGTGDRVRQGGELFYPGLDTGFEGFSTNGTDLFFSTFDTLVPQDKNGSFVKFYDARVNGGFPATPPPLPCTAADECHGDGSATPATLDVGTGGDLGDGGNVKPQHHVRPRHARHRRKSAKKHRKPTQKHRRNHGGRQHG